MSTSIEIQKSSYLEGLLSGVYPDMTHQLTRLLKGFQAYGTFVHRFMLRSSLGLLYYLRLLLRTNKRDKNTTGARHDLFIGQDSGTLVEKRRKYEERNFSYGLM